MQNTPDELRFIMIDPKRVELTPYNSIPQLAVPVIVNAEKAIEALRWLNLEMDNRYQELAKAGVRNIEGYNKNRTGKNKMPYLVLIIDELADLMMPVSMKWSTFSAVSPSSRVPSVFTSSWLHSVLPLMW